MTVIVKHRAWSRKGPRPYQEDRVARYPFPGMVLLIACDGMGGMKGGEATAEHIARCAKQAFMRRITGKHISFTLEQIALECAIYAQVCGLRMHNILEEPGATLLLAVANVVGQVGIAWLGDSPAIHHTKTRCRLLTKPHNVNADALYREKTGATSGDTLTRFVGEKDYLLPPESTSVQLDVGESLYLCTDGALPLFQNPGKEPPSMHRFKELPDAAFTDNASLIEVFVEELPEEPSIQEEAETNEVEPPVAHESGLIASVPDVTPTVPRVEPEPTCFRLPVAP